MALDDDEDRLWTRPADGTGCNVTWPGAAPGNCKALYKAGSNACTIHRPAGPARMHASFPAWQAACVQRPDHACNLRRGFNLDSIGRTRPRANRSRRPVSPGRPVVLRHDRMIESTRRRPGAAAQVAGARTPRPRALCCFAAGTYMLAPHPGNLEGGRARTYMPWWTDTGTPVRKRSCWLASRKSTGDPPSDRRARQVCTFRTRNRRW